MAAAVFGYHLTENPVNVMYEGPDGIK